MNHYIQHSDCIFWALKILNIKLLTSNFCTPLNWRVKILRFCNQKKTKLSSQVEAFHSSFSQEKRFYVCYKPLKIRAYSRNTERPLIRGACWCLYNSQPTNHYFIAYTEKLIHAHFFPLKNTLWNHYYSCRHIL